MADISKIKASDNTVYDIKDVIARAGINVIAEVFTDALDNHTEGFEGLAFKTVTGVGHVSFDTRDLD